MGQYWDSLVWILDVWINWDLDPTKPTCCFMKTNPNQCGYIKSKQAPILAHLQVRGRSPAEQKYWHLVSPNNHALQISKVVNSLNLLSPLNVAFTHWQIWLFPVSSFLDIDFFPHLGSDFSAANYAQQGLLFPPDAIAGESLGLANWDFSHLCSCTICIPPLT